MVVTDKPASHVKIAASLLSVHNWQARQVQKVVESLSGIANFHTLVQLNVPKSSKHVCLRIVAALRA
jgi:hypothetical protein